EQQSRCSAACHRPMPAASYRIARAWPDAIEYEEGEGRSIRLDCPSSGEPPQVRVPPPARWIAQMPDWVRDRRALVIERLRLAGAIVHDEDNDGETRTSRVLAPDGALQIESTWRRDDRAPEWQCVRVIAEPSGEVLAALRLFELDGDPHFPSSAVVLM